MHFLKSSNVTFTSAIKRTEKEPFREGFIINKYSFIFSHFTGDERYGPQGAINNCYFNLLRWKKYTKNSFDDSKTI